MTKPKNESKSPSGKSSPPQVFKTEDNMAESRAKLDALLAEGPFTPMGKYEMRYSVDPFLLDKERANFSNKARKLNGQLEILRKACFEGRLTALKELFLIATEATRMLNELADSAADFVEVEASSKIEWPVLVNESTARDWQKKIVKSIKLGESKPLVGYAPTLEDAKSPATVWTRKLLLFMQFVRDVSGKPRRGAQAWEYNGDFLDALEPLELRLLKNKSADSNSSVTADNPIKNKILQLEDFSMQTAEGWWLVAKEILHLHSKGRPWEDPDLKKLWPGASHDSSLRGKIYDRVRRSFVNSAN